MKELAMLWAILQSENPEYTRLHPVPRPFLKVAERLRSAMGSLRWRLIVGWPPRGQKRDPRGSPRTNHSPRTPLRHHSSNQCKSPSPTVASAFFVSTVQGQHADRGRLHVCAVSLHTLPYIGALASQVPVQRGVFWDEARSVPACPSHDARSKARYKYITHSLLHTACTVDICRYDHSGV